MKKIQLSKICALLVFTLLFFSCENEELAVQEQDVFKTVSIEEANSFFNASKPSFKSKSYNENYISPNLDAITQEEIINSDELLTIIPGTTINEGHYSRILMVKLNDQIETVVFNMYPSDQSTVGSFDGEIILNDLNGSFRTGFRVKEGVPFSMYTINTVSSKNAYANKSNQNVCDIHSVDDPNCIFSTQQLGEVIITGSTNHSSIPLSWLLNPGEKIDTDANGTSGDLWEFGGGGGTSSSTWTNSTVLFESVSDPKIVDIDKYLKCFDLLKEAIITLYVEQPEGNTAKTWSGNPLSPDVGHTFISLSQGNFTRIIGFYPDGFINPFVSPSSSSVLRDNSNHNFHVSISKEISSIQLTSTINQISAFESTYNLNTYNCTDFGISISNSVGMGVRDSTGSWKGGGGSNPGSLGQDIRNMSNANGLIVNLTGGKAPSNTGVCN